MAAINRPISLKLIHGTGMKEHLFLKLVREEEKNTHFFFVRSEEIATIG
jgi:hypothetical protein